MAPFNSGTSTKVTTIALQATKSYYIKVVASKQGGSLKLSVNAKMYNSSLNSKVSSFIKTEVQDIEITSTIVTEKTVTIKNVFLFWDSKVTFKIKEISYGSLNATNGMSEIQMIKITSATSDPFQLSFDGANTGMVTE